MMKLFWYRFFDHRTGRWVESQQKHRSADGLRTMLIEIYGRHIRAEEISVEDWRPIEKAPKENA